MKIFSKLYDQVMLWSQHANAPYYLAGLSFSEAVFFPIPPDVMLAPMSLAKPQKAFRFATISTLASTAGAVLGYALGMFLLFVVMPYIIKFGYASAFQQTRYWFNDYGFWILLIAAFTPLPFKLFTIAAGSLHIALLPFVIGSLIGRGGRFYLVSGLMKCGGEKLQKWLRSSVDLLGWIVIILCLGIFFYYFYQKYNG